MCEHSRHRDGDAGDALDDLREVRLLENEARGFVQRLARGGSRLVREDAHLSEHFAHSEPRELVLQPERVVDQLHRDRARSDHVERVGRVALPKDRLALGVGPKLEALGDLTRVVSADVLEQADLTQERGDVIDQRELLTLHPRAWWPEAGLAETFSGKP